MTAVAGERLSFNSALAATLQDLKLTFSLRKEQRMALKSFLENKYVFGVLINYVVRAVTLFVALIGFLSTFAQYLTMGHASRAVPQKQFYTTPVVTGQQT